MNKVALVTGANGFIGSSLARCLVARGYRVRSMVLRGTPEEFLRGVDTEIVYADITDPATLGPAMRGADTVFHLAARASDWGEWRLFRLLNYEGVLNVLDAALRAGVGRILHVSSLGVHAYRATFGADETHPRDSKLNAYCVTKRMGEEAARQFGLEHDIDVTVVRPGLMPFGPRDTTSFAPLAPALEKGIYQFINGGNARICTAYVENLVEGMAMAAEKPEGVGETFIIADDEPRSWREIMYAYCDALHAKRPRFSIPAYALYPVAAVMMGLWTAFPIPGMPPLTFYRIRVSSQDLYFSNKKAKEVLGWKPRVSFEEGVQNTIEWYRSFKGGGR